MLVVGESHSAVPALLRKALQAGNEDKSDLAK